MKKSKINNTVPIVTNKDITTTDCGATAQPACTRIAIQPDILECLRADLLATGFAGELYTPSALYLILASRVLDRPISAAVKGESAAGKSHVVSTVAALFPKRATLSMTSASDKALFHLKKSLRHRVLIFGEQHGMSSEKLNYYIREFLSNGFIEQYAVRPGKGGHNTRYSRKSGPTSFITTSTSDLHPENETRLLSLSIDESREATAAIMLAIARCHDGSGVKERMRFAMQEWRDFQSWFATQDNKVEITFAQGLAGMIDPNSIRLRRDFGKLLNLIATHALLHRQSRRSGPNGLIAEMSDYRAVWKIMRRTFALSMEKSIDTAIRQTVEAVEAMGSATVTMDTLAKRLGLDKSNAARRYHRAAAAGFLMNRGEGHGRPYAIALAAPLPADDSTLPSPKALRRAIKAAKANPA